MGQPVSDNEFHDQAAAEEMAAAFRAGQVVYGEAVDADEVLPSADRLPADPDDLLVPTTLRLTVGQRRRAQAIAEERGIDMTTLIRGWVAEGLAEIDNDRRVSLADVRRAIASLPTGA